LAGEADTPRFKALKKICRVIITNDFDLIRHHRFSNWLLRKTELLRSKSGKNLPKVIFFFFVKLGFELGTLHLQSGHSSA
jgi:hypothetical protein